MNARIIDGKAFAETLRERIGRAASELAPKLVPGLAVVLVGEDPASQIYTRNKARDAEKAGFKSWLHKLPANTLESDVLSLVQRLNNDPNVHGILVQMPLPSQINANAIVAAISPIKDVDGLHPLNAGLLAQGQPALVPCTPQGCLMLLKHTLGKLEGLAALVIGRSILVGRPMAQLLIGENCTVTVAHSRTRDLPALCRQADILVAAIGKAEFVKSDWLKPGVTIIDVGINRLPGESGKSRLVGDVAFSAVGVAGALTPVPGGVGPMTIACLLRNTLVAACAQANLPTPNV